LDTVVRRDSKELARRWSVVGASILFAASIILLGLKISNPDPIQIVIEGREAEVKHNPEIYTQTDLQWATLLSALAGGSFIYLTTHRTDQAPNTTPTIRGLNPSNSTGVKQGGDSGDKGPPPQPAATSDPFNIEEEKKKMWERIHSGLKGNEKKIYGCILESEGVVPQGDIVRETGLSQGTVSTTLGRLEARDLLEKRKAGITNVIILRTGPRPTTHNRAREQETIEGDSSP